MEGVDSRKSLSANSGRDTPSNLALQTRRATTSTTIMLDKKIKHEDRTGASNHAFPSAPPNSLV